MHNLCQYPLSDSIFFNLYYSLLNDECIDKIDKNKLEQLTYIIWQKKYYYLGDQVFNCHWNQLEQQYAKDKSWVICLLKNSSEIYFKQDCRALAIKDDQFANWQNLLANQTLLPQIAMQISTIIKQKQIDYLQRNNLEDYLKELLGYRAIVSPKNKILDDYIKREGLYETHLHLNGTTIFENMWHQILLSPEKTIAKMHNAFQNSKRVQLLFACDLAIDSPNDLLDKLYLARFLREKLLKWIETSKIDFSFTDKNNQDKRYFSLNECQNMAFREEPKRFKTNDPKNSHIAEVKWQVELLLKLKNSSKNEKEKIDNYYLLYLQCMNMFYKFTVQKENEFGFEQFQKYADNDSRDKIEENYTNRFYQLHGTNTEFSNIKVIEGRFAPKATIDKNIKIIRNILYGFLKYKQETKLIAKDIDLSKLDECELSSLIEMTTNDKNSRPRLLLVAHFIKKAWSVYKNGGFHYKTTREDLEQKAYQLCELLNVYPDLDKIVTGIDAAANELETPPEVFAPIYRYCRNHGIRNFTYHVGEDFNHLLTGIRNIYDAITLLDLKHGDRVGHATAIGIDPKMWLELMPATLYIKRGEWIANLFFLREIALDNIDSKIKIERLELRIKKLVAESNIRRKNIAHDRDEKPLLNNSKSDYRYFKHKDSLNDISEDDFYTHWKLRHLDPKCIENLLEEGPITIPAYEFNLMQELSLSELEILYKFRYDRSFLKSQEELIEVSLDEIRYDVLLESQQMVQKLVAEKKVIVESLPTSNLRISIYEKMHEHHIFRWLQLPDRVITGDYKMLVSLGADDPGIFATDIKNEIYHIFSCLVNNYNYDCKDALTKVAELNENGRIYNFRDN